MHVAGLCNGSTADSDSVCLGSNPSPAAKTTKTNRFRWFFCAQIRPTCLVDIGVSAKRALLLNENFTGP